MTDLSFPPPGPARAPHMVPASSYPLQQTHAEGSRKVLAGAAVAWFAVAASGQAIFLLYILMLYGVTLFTGDYGAWSRMMPRGLVDGDIAGNAATIAHVLIAAVVTASGALQLIPAIRTRYRVFHRWNGRVYLATVTVASLTGLWMVWNRSQLGGIVQHSAMTINAVLILVAATLVLRHALARRMEAHRRWALRLFMLASGVWFFRVGLMFWIAVNGGPVGFDPTTFRGPALDILTFLQYLLPLALLEIYFRARESDSRAVRLSTAGMLMVMTLAMGLGIGMATIGMWLPNL